MKGVLCRMHRSRAARFSNAPTLAMHLSSISSPPAWRPAAATLADVITRLGVPQLKLWPNSEHGFVGPNRVFKRPTCSGVLVFSKHKRKAVLDCERPLDSIFGILVTMYASYFSSRRPG